MHPHGNFTIDSPSPLPTCWCELRSSAYSSTYKGFNLVFILLIIPILGFCGAITNIVNVYIFNLRRERCSSRSKASTFIYLIALSISHGLISVFGGLIIWLDSVKAYNTFLRRYGSWLISRILPFGIVTSTCSTYYTIGATMERFLRALSFSSCQKCFQQRIATVTVVCILLWSVLYNSVRVFEMKCVQCWEPVYNRSEYEICATSFSSSRFMAIYHMWISTLFGTFLPFTLLFVVNTIMIGMLRVRRSKMRMASIGMCVAQFAAGSMKKRPTRKKSSLQRQVLKFRRLFNVEQMELYSDKALVVVVIMFLLCNSVDVAITIAQRVVVTPTVGFMVMIHYLVDIKNVLTMISTSVNIIIYYTCDRAYRNYFKLKILRMHRVIPELQQQLRDERSLREGLFSALAASNAHRVSSTTDDLPHGSTGNKSSNDESSQSVYALNVVPDKVCASQIARSFSEGNLTGRFSCGEKLPGKGLHGEAFMGTDLWLENSTHDEHRSDNGYIEQEPFLSAGFVSSSCSNWSELYV